MLPTLLVRACPPVRELLIVRRFRDLLQARPIGFRCEGVLSVCTRQIEREHNTLPVRRPAWLKRERAARTRLQGELMLTSAIRMYDVQTTLAVVGQDPLPFA